MLKRSCAIASLKCSSKLPLLKNPKEGGSVSTTSPEKKTLTFNRVLNLSAEDVLGEPFPHIVKDDIIDPGLYRRLKAEYPSDDVFSSNTSLGGRAGRDLYRGDVAYDQLLANSPAWSEFHNYINSPEYVDRMFELFGKYLGGFMCQVDPEKTRFANYIEPREALAEKSRLGRAVEGMAGLMRAGSLNKDELFVRLDLAQGAVGYGKSVHCDRPNRLTSMLVYFCDAQAIGMEGGELRLHEHLQKKPPEKYERHPKPELTRVIGEVLPKENRGIFFLCTNNSYHSATAVKAQKSYRNFIYVSISSRAPSIW
jgi:hypothetical protein